MRIWWFNTEEPEKCQSVRIWPRGSLLVITRVGSPAVCESTVVISCSKLAVEEWATKDVHLDIEQPIQVQHLYRGMDFLLKYEAEIQEKVFWATAQLLNLTVDLILFDTTIISFEMDDLGDSELLVSGKSKHKRNDLP